MNHGGVLPRATLLLPRADRRLGQRRAEDGATVAAVVPSLYKPRKWKPARIILGNEGTDDEAVWLGVDAFAGLPRIAAGSVNQYGVPGGRSSVDSEASHTRSSQHLGGAGGTC
jgi:hypothetical protein